MGHVVEKVRGDGESRCRRPNGVSRIVSALCVLGLAGSGCRPAPPAVPVLPPPEVTVAAPAATQVVDDVKFTGRAEPAEEVEVRARVGGFLTKIHFEPGTEVKAGDLLMEIDARPFAAELDRANAEISQAEARLERLNGEFTRAQPLREKGAISVDEFQKIVGDRAEATATVKAAQAKAANAKLNLDDCRITAPLGGRIGDRLVDQGNLVTGGQGGATLLTTIVAVDPVAVGFDIDENTLQRLQQAVREGKLEETKDKQIPVEAGLAIHGAAYPISGFIRFFNNRVDPRTGTIRLKAEFPNPQPPVGGRILVPGMFTRVRLPLGKPRDAWVVPEAALGSDLGRRFLYLVDSQDSAQRFDVETGVLTEKGREILSLRAPGETTTRPLAATDRVIVDGLTRVRPGVKVAPLSATKPAASPVPPAKS